MTRHPRLSSTTRLPRRDHLLGVVVGVGERGADPLEEFFDISTWLTAIVGSIVLLRIDRAVVGHRSGHRLTHT